MHFLTYPNICTIMLNFLISNLILLPSLTLNFLFCPLIFFLLQMVLAVFFIQDYFMAFSIETLNPLGFSFSDMRFIKVAIWAQNP